MKKKSTFPKITLQTSPVFCQASSQAVKSKHKENSKASKISYDKKTTSSKESKKSCFKKMIKKILSPTIFKNLMSHNRDKIIISDNPASKKINNKSPVKKTKEGMWTRKYAAKSSVRSLVLKDEQNSEATIHKDLPLMDISEASVSILMSCRVEDQDILHIAGLAM